MIHTTMNQFDTTWNRNPKYNGNTCLPGDCAPYMAFVNKKPTHNNVFCVLFIRKCHRFDRNIYIFCTLIKYYAVWKLAIIYAIDFLFSSFLISFRIDKQFKKWIRPRDEVEYRFQNQNQAA